jgi:hypothetical protein
MLRPLVGDGFRVYFTPLFEVLFTFPSQYWFAIGLSGVFSLTGWSPQIHTGFLVSRATQDTTRLRHKSCTGLSPSMAVLSKTFHFLISCHIVVLQPLYCRNSIGLGCSAFARHYLRNHFCFLLLRVLRCFSSPRLPSLRNDRPSTCRVAPFGNHGIKGYLHIPRSLSQLITSFFASESQGIHRLPLLTFFFRAHIGAILLEGMCRIDIF